MKDNLYHPCMDTWWYLPALNINIDQMQVNELTYKDGMCILWHSYCPILSFHWQNHLHLVIQFHSQWCQKKHWSKINKTFPPQWIQTHFVAKQEVTLIDMIQHLILSSNWMYSTFNSGGHPNFMARIINTTLATILSIETSGCNHPKSSFFFCSPLAPSRARGRERPRARTDK